jgi:hypothetical protein
VLPLDRVAFRRQHYPTIIPIKIYYTSRSYVKRGRGPGVTRWRLTISEAYHGAFDDWQIGLTPGDYEFEDCGSPLLIIGEQRGTYALFVFPLATNYAWILQRHSHVDTTTSLTPCWLHVSQSRGPRIGGYLHPHCYGVPGDIDTCKQSRRALYMPTSVFAQDGVVICRSWAAAMYKGRAASYFSTKGGAVVLRAFDTEPGLLAYARLSTPFVADRPAVVPYIRSQLLYHDILDKNDMEGTFRDPIQYQGLAIGKKAPILFHYNRESQQRTPWTPSHPPNPVISGELDDPTDMIAGREIAVASPEPQIPPPQGNDDSKVSKSSSATYSVSEERERSKDRLARLYIPPLPHGNKEAIGWGEMLPWLLSGQFWCHDGVHACDIPVTTDDNRMLSQDLLMVIQRAATVHKSAATQRGVQSLLKEEIGSVNGLALIKEGKGFEVFQLRIRTGYSRGLGSETMSYLRDFMHAVQHSEETVDSFAT